MTKTATKAPNALKFEKENVATLSFSANDVLTEKSELGKRKVDTTSPSTWCAKQIEYKNLFC